MFNNSFYNQINYIKKNEIFHVFYPEIKFKEVLKYFKKSKIINQKINNQSINISKF